MTPKCQAAINLSWIFICFKFASAILYWSNFFLSKKAAKVFQNANILIGGVKTIWELCVFRERHSVPLTNVANGDNCFFTERDWSQEYYHGNNIVGVSLFLLWCTFLVPSLKNTSQIFLEIFLVLYFIHLYNHLWRHHFPHLHNTKL